MRDRRAPIVCCRAAAGAVLAALAFASLPASARDNPPPFPPQRPAAADEVADVPYPPRRPLRHDAAPGEPDASTCQRRLAGLAEWDDLPPVEGNGECGAEDAILLREVILPSGKRVRIQPRPTIRCEMAEALAKWVREDVAGGAMGEREVTALAAGTAYECRGRNRVSGAKLSQHGYANAIDITGFVLGDKSTLSLVDAAAPKDIRERLRASACARFTTVLGPGSDGYHEDHIHLDLAERRSGYRLCQWDVK